jgi:Uncharacterized conserved protein
MSIQSDNPEHGFQFPGIFELTAMGPASAGLEDEIPRLLEQVGIEVLRETVATRDSTGGKYVSVRLSIKADTREEYDAAHQALRDHPEVKWTL